MSRNGIPAEPRDSQRYQMSRASPGSEQAGEKTAGAVCRRKWQAGREERI